MRLVANTVHEIREKLSVPASKSKIQIRDIFPRETWSKNPKSAKSNSYEKFPATQKIVNEFVFRAI